MNRTRFSLPVRVSLVITLVAFSLVTAFASKTETWTRSGKTFRVGTLEGMAIAPDGTLVPGPHEIELVRPPVGVSWCGLLMGKTALVGASDGGGLYELEIDADGSESAITLDTMPDVFAVARSAKGEIYAATGPSGAIYQLRPDRNQARLVAKLDAVYVWDLVVLADGAIAAATGLPATVQRIDPKSGEKRALFESTDDHVRALALGPDGALYAGTSGTGQIVRLDAQGKHFVVYDGARPEVVALAFAKDGALFAAFVGASGRAPLVPTPAAKNGAAEKETADESIVVRAQVDGNDGDGSAREGDASRSTDRAVLPAGGGELVRIPGSGEPTVLWSDKSETPLALAPWGGDGVLLGTGGPARVWWFDAKGGEGILLALTETRAVTVLDTDASRVLLATSQPPIIRVYDKSAGARTSPARYISDVIDAKARATWGAVHAVTARESAARVRVQARAGNTAEPGFGWTEWMDVVAAAGPPDSAGAAGAFPQARYFQVKLEAQGDTAITSLHVRYQPVNRPPRVTNVSAQPPGVAWRPMPPPPVASGDEPIVAPTVSGEAEDAIGKQKRGWRPKKVYEAGALTLTWEASDPDGDDVIYELASCLDTGAPCDSWTVLAAGLAREFHAFDARLLPDGVYRFRVTASDAAANSFGSGATGFAISDPVLVDATAPVITEALALAMKDGRAQILVRARDAAGRLARAEVTADPAGTWITLPAADGVIDEQDEEWTTSVPIDGARAFTLRVTDAAGNVTTARVPITR